MKENKYIFAQLINKYRNFILYGVIGGFCAGLDFGVYTLLCYFGAKYIIANMISVNCGIFFSFVLNRQFNFRVKDRKWRRLLSFYLVGLTGLALSSLLLYWMVDRLFFDEVYSKLFTVVIIALFQFVLNKLVTFKKINR